MLKQEFLKKCKSVYQEGDYALICYALEYATQWHEGQLRASGEPYINHPIGAALTLVELGMDASSVCAALLHDVIEDTECDALDLKKKFGEEIYNLVEAVTKLSKLKYKFNSREEEQAENLRKLFFAISKDLRVLFIKLADRLHNMRTLDSLPPEKQKRIAQETLDIYAPMSARLGISNVKCELEDLSMKYLYNDAYKYLAGELDQKRQERMQYVKRIADEIQAELDAVNIKAEIKGRPKHFYSIYKKMVNQNKTLDQIYDLIAVRVIVEDVKECYTVLGIIHSMWKPVPGRFKDYIAMPKPNLYQSLHTTVVSNFGQIFEIQIRTYEMNRIAEFGIAAHWKYKESKGSNVADSDFDKKLSWVREVMESEEDINDSKEYLFTFKNSIVLNEIYVFSPKGEVFDLPMNATPVDFAYKVHSQVGNKCIGAKVNNKMVPLNTPLNTGDVIEIVTSNAGKGPSRDWLKFVVSSQAKAKIRAFFKKERAGENIKLGRDMIEKEAKRKGFDWNLLAAMDAEVDDILKRYSLSSLDDLYAAIGYGALKTGQVLFKLIDKYRKAQALNQKVEALLAPQETTTQAKPTKKKSSSGVLIEGYGDFMVKLARCCNPVPGDEIVGYAMRGAGVSIHRKDCPNVKGMESQRLMNASWANTDNSVFQAKLLIECVDRTGLATSILPMISNQGIYMTSVDMRVNKGVAIIHITLEIRSADELDYIINKIESHPDTISIKRG